MRLGISVEKIHQLVRKYSAWLLSLVFIGLFVLIALAYYQYVYLTIKFEPVSGIEKPMIERQTLDQVLRNISVRENNLLRVQTDQYTDPFNE